jgi:hypothetical protein
LDLFTDDRLVLLKGLGDYSPGPAYAAVPTHDLINVSLDTFAAKDIGPISALSNDRVWAVLGQLTKPTEYSLVRVVDGKKFYSENVSNGPDMYGYEFSPHANYLIELSIPGKESEQTVGYAGSSELRVLKRSGESWAKLGVVLASGQGEPIKLGKWQSESVVQVIFGGKTYALDLETRKTVAQES